jgi:hypothetical protein
MVVQIVLEGTGGMEGSLGAVSKAADFPGFLILLHSDLALTCYASLAEDKYRVA